MELARFAETSSRRVSLQGPAVMLNSEVAIPLGMAIHELTSNSVKHGSLSAERGSVTVTWGLETARGSPTLHLDWIERGGPTVVAPSSQGYGARVLERVLGGQVGAKVSANYDPEGLRIAIEIPLAPRRDEAAA
jgi:two-component sensor histidine kinase